MSPMQSNRSMLHDSRPNDVVIAVAASGTTPFTVAALQQAGTYGAVTIGVANNPGTALLTSAKFPVLVETGRELIAGSTRMKAGTAQKIVLNLISTGIMLRLGCVYRGMMVNMQTTNAKLKRRAEVMVARIAGCSQEQAACALERDRGGYQDGRSCGVGLRQGGSREHSRKASRVICVGCSRISPDDCSE